MSNAHKVKKNKFDDPLLPMNWASIRLLRVSNSMAAWCLEQKLELGRDYMLYTQEEEAWIFVGDDADQEPMHFRTMQPVHYFFFKNPVNATAFGLKFYENCNC